MNSALAMLLFEMIVFVVAAWGAYALDRRYGQRWYRKFYDISHEKPLSADVIRGFICGRQGQTKVIMALVLSLVVTLLLATFSEGNILRWFFTWVLGAVAALFGFITGPLVTSLWKKRTRAYTVIDELELGKVGPATAEDAGIWIGTFFSGWRAWFADFWHGPAPSVLSPAEQPADSAGISSEVPEPVSSSDDELGVLLNSGERPAAPVGPLPHQAVPPPVSRPGQSAIDKFTHGGS